MSATSILDRYRYISRLGAGGSSTVVLAEDTLLGRRVALKRIHTPDDLAARSRLRREALIGASLGHPNLVPIFDIATTEDGEDVIVMEYVEGETLADRLRDGKKPELAEALRILGGVSSALDAIHERRIVHRDVKPANILLGVEGAVKLADLGIAALPDRTRITSQEAVVGTFRYMAPEQLEGVDATPAVDVYALAAVAYEALSGEKARHEPNPLALAHAIATQPPPDLRSVWPQAPVAAAETLIRGMSRDPRQRPRTAGELTARLREALHPHPTEAAATARDARTEAATAVPAVADSVAPRERPQAERSRRSPRPALLAAAAMLLAAGAIAAIVLAGSGRPRQTVAGVQAHRHVTSPPAHQTAKTGSATSASTTPAGSPSPGSAASSSGTGSSANAPIAAVETFYRLAASHQYSAAWALADPAFRQQMQGYQGLEGTMAQERSITFDGANVVNQSANAATVAVRTTSVRSNGTQHCSGTVALVRSAAGAPAWLLDHISISCA